MANHFIGTTVGGQRARFNRELTEQEFQELLDRIGGELPKGFWAWHFEEDVDYKCSKRAQAVAKLPKVVDSIGAIVDPVEAIVRAKREQQTA